MEITKKQRERNKLTVLCCNASEICLAPVIPMLFCARFSVFNVCFNKSMKLNRQKDKTYLVIL